MSIKAVLWDMGGVILRMKDETPRHQLADRYGLPLDKIYQAIFDSPSAKMAGVGVITIQDHWNAVAAELGLAPAVMPEFQSQFWSADEIDDYLVEYIRSLRPKFKTGLITNAWDDLREVIEHRWQIADIFDHMVISSEVGIAKPDRRIYLLAVESLGVDPGEAVFIDDVAENIAAAKQAGLTAFQFLNREQTLDELNVLINPDHSSTYIT